MNEHINYFNLVFDDSEVRLSKNFVEFISDKYEVLDFDKINLKSKKHINFTDLDSYKFNNNILFETGFKNAHFECYLSVKKSKRLIIMLSAARTKPRLPRFQRVSYSNLTNDNYLFIEDPTYYLNNDLKVAWYFGDKDNNFCKYTSEIVRKIANNLKIKDENVIFFGSSCAGTAAIAISKMYSDYSTAISINGQINFEYFHKDIESYENIMGFHIKDDPEDRGNIISIIRDSYIGSTNRKIILIENVASRWDYMDHLIYLCNKLDLKVKYPLSKKGNLFIWMYYALTDKPHVAHDDKELYPLVYSVINKILGEEQLEILNNNCQIINYIWKIHYDRISDYTFYFIKEFDYANSTEIVHRDELVISASQTDNYNHYEIPINNKGNYSLSIKRVICSSCHKFSIGLFNKKLRTFIFLNEYDTANSVVINFFVSTHDSLFLDIFTGTHGNTRNIELKLLDFGILYKS